MQLSRLIRTSSADNAEFTLMWNRGHKKSFGTNKLFMTWPAVQLVSELRCCQRLCRTFSTLKNPPPNDSGESETPFIKPTLFSCRKSRRIKASLDVSDTRCASQTSKPLMVGVGVRCVNRSTARIREVMAMHPPDEYSSERSSGVYSVVIQRRETSEPSCRYSSAILC